MRNISLIVLFLSTTIQLSAQISDYMTVRAHYMASFKRYEGDITTQEEKVLDISRGRSYFYGRWLQKREHITDSVKSKGGNFNDILALISDYPSPKEYYAIYKNYPQKGMLTTTDRALKKFYYSEPIERLKWQLIPRDTTLLTYKCQFATTTFRGRSWRVCYTLEIPISEGPWKLHGLPGLILYAEEESGTFKFECIELTRESNDAAYEPKLKSHIKCTLPELQKIQREMYRNPADYAKRLGMPSEGYGPDGKPIQYKERKPLFLEK
ncbi:MAG: GLPGLI family protein [Phocaeicola sp.]